MLETLAPAVILQQTNIGHLTYVKRQPILFRPLFGKVPAVTCG